MEEKKYYALTVNKNYRKNVKMHNSDYADIILTLHYYIVNYSFEYGDIQKRLHCHMLLKVPDEDMEIIIGKLKRYKGFYYYLEECTNYEGWLQYINKEKSFFVL